VKFHNKISLAVSSAIFELKSKVTTFTLTLAELFVVGGVRSGLIKGLRVLSSELAEGLVFSLTERHEMLGCQTGTNIECIIKREERNGLIKLNAYLGIPFQGCQILDKFIIDEAGTNYQLVEGEISRYSPLPPSKCLTAIISSNIQDIRHFCQLGENKNENFRLIEDGVLITRIHMSTLPALTHLLNRSPTDKDIPLRVLGDTLLTFPNFEFESATGLKLSKVTLKLPFDPIHLCPVTNQVNSLQDYINNTLSPMGGTSLVMSGIGMIFLVGQYIYFFLSIKSVKGTLKNLSNSSENDCEELRPLTVRTIAKPSKSMVITKRSPRPSQSSSDRVTRSQTGGEVTRMALQTLIQGRARPRHHQTS